MSPEGADILVERLILTARVDRLSMDNGDAKYVALVEGIDVRGEGESPDSAREELIQAMLSWISDQDCAESMAGVLAEAGFPRIDDDTELELEFVLHSEIPASSTNDGAP